VSNLLDRTAADVMTRGPVTVAADVLATEALLVMEQRKITAIVVADETGRVQGVLHLHDLWRTEMI
jgi:arabinose-5-phosphate isomerase